MDTNDTQSKQGKTDSQINGGPSPAAFQPAAAAVVLPAVAPSPPPSPAPAPTPRSIAAAASSPRAVLPLFPHPFPSPIAAVSDSAASSSVSGSTARKCNCKNSKCLKLYCECFSSGQLCGPACHCQGCLNTPSNQTAREEAQQIIRIKNPHAFKPKIATSSPGGRAGAAGGGRRSSPHHTDPNSALSSNTAALWTGATEEVTPGGLQVRQVHHKGCHCKKSQCLKKYCECFQASIYCGENCRCDGCKNHEGSKERTILEAKGQVKPVRKMDAATVAAAAAAAASAAASGTIRDGSHQTQPGLLPLGPHYQALMSHHSSGGSLSVGIAAASSLMLPSSNLPPPTASLSGVFMPTNSQNRTAMQLQQLQQIQQQQQQQQQQSPATVSTKQMIENTVKAYVSSHPSSSSSSWSGLLTSDLLRHLTRQLIETAEREYGKVVIVTTNGTAAGGGGSGSGGGAGGQHLQKIKQQEKQQHTKQQPPDENSNATAANDLLLLLASPVQQQPSSVKLEGSELKKVEMDGTPTKSSILPRQKMTPKSLSQALGATSSPARVTAAAVSAAAAFTAGSVAPISLSSPEASRDRSILRQARESVEQAVHRAAHTTLPVVSAMHLALPLSSPTTAAGGVGVGSALSSPLPSSTSIPYPSIPRLSPSSANSSSSSSSTSGVAASSSVLSSLRPQLPAAPSSQSSLLARMLLEAQQKQDQQQQQQQQQQQDDTKKRKRDETEEEEKVTTNNDTTTADGLQQPADKKVRFAAPVPGTERTAAVDGAAAVVPPSSSTLPPSLAAPTPCPTSPDTAALMCDESELMLLESPILAPQQQYQQQHDAPLMMGASFVTPPTLALPPPPPPPPPPPRTPSPLDASPDAQLYRLQERVVLQDFSSFLEKLIERHVQQAEKKHTNLYSAAAAPADPTAAAAASPTAAAATFPPPHWSVGGLAGVSGMPDPTAAVAAASRL